MTKLDCEVVCMEAMARADGYVSELSADQIEAHLAGCSECRREVQQLRKLTTMLDGHKRQQPTADVWQKVSERLPADVPKRTTSRTWYPFMVLGLLLLGYRLMEMIPDRHFGLLFKLIPVVFVVAAFGYLRENPFKVNAELELEGRATR
jgi:anti-sigma factor RsiW